MIWRFSLLSLLLVLAGCDYGEPNPTNLRNLEGPEGEALVRYVIAHLPDVVPSQPKKPGADPNAPGPATPLPRVYCIVLGSTLNASSPAFAGRFADLKLTFVSADSLKARNEDKTVIDPVSGLSPITLQIGEIKHSSAETFTAVAGWAYKKTWERRKYKLVKKDGGFEVHDAGRLEGNYEAPG